MNLLRLSLYKTFLRPHSRDVDARRQELIVNVLLTGIGAISLIALFADIAVLLSERNVNGLHSTLITAAFFLIIVSCHRAVRYGKANIVAYGVSSIVLLSSIQLMFEWGYVLPLVPLMLVLFIVLTGIMLGARSGLYATIIVILVLPTAAYLQTHNLINSNLDWRTNPPVFIDVIGYMLTISIVGLVSWLSNREIGEALRRARLSEQALTNERDSLDNKVKQRTQELEEVQLMRLIELERFAAFGKIGSALVHDLANPVMAAGINLRHLKNVDPNHLSQIDENLKQMEQQLESARRQLKGSAEPSYFKVEEEIKKVIRSLRGLTRQHGLQLHVHVASDLRMYGDVVKFQQIVSNLLSNAIESYTDDIMANRRTIDVSVKAYGGKIILSVRDQGRGIGKKDVARIFDPFFTNKREGLGIGLDIVKRFVEIDYKGKIEVQSKAGFGTCFQVTLLKQYY